MPYTTTIMPRIRRQAADLVHKGWSAKKVGRYLGYHHTAVMKWVKKAKVLGHHPIPTQSSKPKSHPKQLSEDIVNKIVSKRLEHDRYAEAVHKELQNDSVNVSLSSVKRTLERKHLIKKRSPWKRYNPHQERPYPLKSGDLVEIDTIHTMLNEKKRIYTFALIDVHSRFAYAKTYGKMNSKTTLHFVHEAEKSAPFHFQTLQSIMGRSLANGLLKEYQSHIDIHGSENRMTTLTLNDSIGLYKKNAWMHRKKIRDHLIAL